MHPERIRAVIAEVILRHAVGDFGQDVGGHRVRSRLLIRCQSEHSNAGNVRLAAGNPSGYIEAMNVEHLTIVAKRRAECCLGAQVSRRQPIREDRIDLIQDADAFAERPEAAHRPPAKTLIAGTAGRVDRAAGVGDEIVKFAVVGLHIQDKFEAAFRLVEQIDLTCTLVFLKVDNGGARHIIDGAQSFARRVFPGVIGILRVNVNERHVTPIDSDRLGQVTQMIKIDQIRTCWNSFPAPTR